MRRFWNKRNQCLGSKEVVLSIARSIATQADVLGEGEDAPFAMIPQNELSVHYGFEANVH
jgi:hypothetical protein